jgi:hypothetical protein
MPNAINRASVETVSVEQSPNHDPETTIPGLFIPGTDGLGPSSKSNAREESSPIFNFSRTKPPVCPSVDIYTQIYDLIGVENNLR